MCSPAGRKRAVYGQTGDGIKQSANQSAVDAAVRVEHRSVRSAGEHDLAGFYSPAIIALR
jgi:hypothetical protein